MQLTKNQKTMIQEGLPPSCIISQDERKKSWDESPPKPMPAFNSSTTKSQDQETLKLLAEIEANKKVKAKNKIHKMLDKKEDRTGQRWDPRTSRWIDEAARMEKAMITITTNTRGSTKMPTKDYAEMSLVELAEAYNKVSGKEPIKKFKDKATGLKRMAEIQTAKAAAKQVAAANKSDVVRKPKKEPKEGSENKRAAEFGCRVGSFREKLIIALDENYRKMIPELDLLKAVYGSKNTENSGALGMVWKGAQTMIEKNKLPYELKKEKNDAKEVSFGLFPK